MTRARHPDQQGVVERDGVGVAWEAFGDGPATLLLLPAWSIVPSRHWKAQVPYLARHARVLTFDGRGSGRSDRPADPAAYTEEEFTADALAVLDATGTERAVLVSLSRGSLWSVRLAAEHPERVAGALHLAPAVPIGPRHDARVHYGFRDHLDTDEGWAKFNEHYWRADQRGFVEFFFRQTLPEPHSTKQLEDAVGWGMGTTAEVLIATELALGGLDAEEFAPLCARVRCPVLVVHGDRDRLRPVEQAAVLAEATRGRLVVLEGSGHLPHTRDPVKVNRLIADFAGIAPPPAARWTRASRRRRRALYLSSPIGLGHARRDLAVVRELRDLVPELQVDWLAQHPVTAVLEGAGERVHPASRFLASESAHFQDEAADHDLNAFQAIRRMDEILVANFMVFQEVVEDGGYDLVVGDEAWDVDYFWHENPELKRSAFAWMTDFVGWLPTSGGDPADAPLTADYNAEMIEQVARFPRVRDRAVFVGDPQDVVDRSFGPGLPAIRDWVGANYDFAGYVTGFDPAALGEREEVRARLGYRDDQRVVVVSVGGSGVGGPLLRRVLAAHAEVARKVDGLRMIAVCGPRIDPASLGAPPGVEVAGYVPDLHHHLAACDLALVQGGLTTCMELAACRTPFLYFPLRGHFEQQEHVAHRLGRYRAGRRMDYADATPDHLAAAIAEELDRPATPLPVATDGAARAAALIAALL